MAIYSLVERRDVIEILSTGFGKRMIFIVFAMGKEEISSSKASMITISPLKSTTDDQISKIFSLSCTAMDLMTETVNLSRESPPQFSLLLGVREYPRGGYSHTLPIRVCAAQRGRDFKAPDLERGIHFRGVF